MADVIKRGNEAIWRVVETSVGVLSWRNVHALVRCRDCQNLAVAKDGSIYCNWWGRKVPLDGYCHNGKKESEDGEQ